jgi:hypothetical protein
MLLTKGTKLKPSHVTKAQYFQFSDTNTKLSTLLYKRLKLFLLSLKSDVQ